MSIPPSLRHLLSCPLCEVCTDKRSHTEHVETLLHKTQDPTAAAATDPIKAMPMNIDPSGTNPAPSVSMGATLGIPTPSIAINGEPDTWQHFNGESPQPGAPLEEFNFNSMPMGMGVGNNFTWEMIGLGLEEPLPPQDTIDELSVLSRPLSAGLRELTHLIVIKFTSKRSILRYP